MDISTRILSDITVYMKYAKYRPELKRRETWKELVKRNMDMHIKTYPNLKEEIKEVYKFVSNKKILPSMRSMQFAGKPLNYHQIEFIIVHLHRQMIGEYFQKLCSYYWVELE